MVGEIEPSKLYEAYTGFRDLFNGSTSRTVPFTAEQRQKIIDRYKNALGLGTDVKFSSTAFDDVAKSRKSDFHIFKTDSPEIHKQLAVTTGEHAAAAKVVRDGIAEALTADSNFATAQKKYTESAATFTQLVKDVPAKYGAVAVISTMTELKDDGVKAIKEQQKLEVAVLTAKFDDQTFKDAMKTSLSLTSDADFENAKSSMLKDLNKAHSESLAAFEKSTSESLKIVHDAAATERAQGILRVALCHNNKKMQELFRLAAAKRDEDANRNTPLTASIGFDENKTYLSGIKIQDLNVIESITGRSINKTGEGQYTIDFPMKILAPLYYLDPRNNVDTDLMIMAAAIRVQGYTCIEHDINIENERIAKERAKQAVLADIEAGFGFDDKEIKVRINGREMKLAELYKDSPAEVSALKQRAVEVKKLIDAVKPTAEDNASVKARMAEIVSEAKAKEAADRQAAQVAQVKNGANPGQPGQAPGL